jgi:tetratricopeptide (TPR) repeat protein
MRNTDRRPCPADRPTAPTRLAHFGGHVLRCTALALALLATAGCQSGGAASTQDRAAAKKQWAGARANVLANLAKEQYDGGLFEKCRSTLNDALRIDPDNAPLRVLSARLAIEQGSLELAEQELLVARRLDPNSAEADYLSGVVCQRWQRAQEAHDYYRSAAAKQPSELAYLLAQAEMLVNLGRGDEALALLQAKVVYFEYSATIRDAVGQLLMQKGLYAQAVDVFRQASVLAADDESLREHLAMAFYHAKQYRDAADALARVLRADAYAKRADLYVALGECQLQLNKPRDAREAFETATTVGPNQSAAWTGLGKAALRLNDLRRAEIALRRAVTIDPAAAETHLLLGYARLKQGQLDEALGSFRKASALDPADTVSVCMIGLVLEKQGKNADALRQYAKALKLRPGDDLATRLMAGIQLDR